MRTHPKPRLLLSLFGLAMALPVGGARAEDAVNGFVDRLSTRIAPALAAPLPDGDAKLRALEAPAPGDRVTVDHVVLAGCDAGELCKLKLDVSQATKGPRLLLVDAGAIFRGPGGADYVAVPNQQFVVEQEKVSLELEALPLWPRVPAAPQGTALQAVGSNDPGLIAVLRTVQRIESDDAVRMRRYLKPEGDGFVVDTPVDNPDVHAAKWMTWTKDRAGQAQGKYPRDAVRLALYAVTSGYTINETADWLRRVKGLDMNPAIAGAGELAPRVELLLERAGLNHRVFSPGYADYHFNRGVRAYRAGDLDTAEKAFRMAIDKQSNLLAAHYNLGITLYRKGKYDDADGAFQIGTGLPDAPADMFYNRAATLYRKGDMLGAARALRRALEINALDPDAPKWLEKADPENKTAPKVEKPDPKKKKKK